MQSSEKVKRNFQLGVASQILTILLGIIVPRLVLTSYGSEVNGLINSITQIYSYIALLEAGVGTATLQALYKTIGNNNKARTNAVLAAANKYYHRTGILYLFAIIIFAVIYPLVVTSDIPPVTIVLIIVFNGLGNVINYFFQGKYNIFLQAEGKEYIKTALLMFTNVLRNVAKIVLISYGMDVVFVQAIAMVISLIQMIYITYYIHKNYKWIDLKVVPDFKAISQSKNVLVHQFSYLIFNNTDTIILTLFCGLKTVSVYAMYTMLFSMISTALSTVSGSVTFVLGQTFHNNRESFLKYYDCYELYYMTLVFFLYSVANFFILPFMACYTRGVTDIEYLDKYLPSLFILTYLLTGGRSACTQVVNFAGHFRQTQSRAIIESIINLAMSLICVHYFGIYGVLFGTILALLYRTNDLIFYANKKILCRTVWITYKRWIINLMIYILIVIVNQHISWELTSYKSIILYCIPYGILTGMFYFGIASLSEPETAKYAFALLKKKIT